MTTPATPSTADRDLARLSNDRLFAYVYDGPDRSARRISDASTLPESAGSAAEFFTESAGSAAEFLLVHGLPGSARDFRWLAPVLATHGARVVRVEMPGFGETPLSTEPDPSLEARGRFVLDVVDALALSRPVLVGHSMGGVVGTMAASLAPERFAGLALVSSPGLRVHRELRHVRPKLVEKVLAWPLAERVLRTPMRRAFERSGFRHATDLGIRHTMRCVAATDVEEHGRRLCALQLPVMHAFCDGDPFIERAIFEETARAVGGPVLRFADGGHNPQKHQAVELGDALVRFARGELF